jgi:hypothetical protein
MGLEGHSGDEPCAVSVMGVPFALERQILPIGTVEAKPDAAPDAVVLTQPNAAYLLPMRLTPAMAAIVPVIDATQAYDRQANTRRADVVIGGASRSGIADAAVMLAPAVSRLRKLPPTIQDCADPRVLLLARLFVRDRDMAPRSDPRVKETIIYDDEQAIPGARSYAERLVELGLMERRFSDMLTTCPHCSSGRLSVRECCEVCGSANVVEQPIIHHLVCAYQAPEQEFVREGNLTCPKCRKDLRQFNLDYDRPGAVCACRACGHMSADASVRFVCLDCESWISAGDTETRPVYVYALTQTAKDCLLAGSPLPEPVVDSAASRMTAFLKQHNATGRPFCVFVAQLRPPQNTPLCGRAWSQTCSFFGLLMRECFTPDTTILERPRTYYAFLEGDCKEDVERSLPEIRSRLQRHLALSPHIDFMVFASEEFSAIVEKQTHH